MSDQPASIQTGDTYDDGLVMPGHYATVQTPVGCLCCGQDSYYGGALCLCKHVQRWHQSETREIACELHLIEKVKDGLFHL